MTVHLGLVAPFGAGMITSAGFLRDYAGTLEECGVESVWTVEHVVVAEDYEPRYPYSADGRMGSAPGTVPMPDPLELLAFFAAATDRLRLGTAVVVAPLHPPAVLAKRAATVDRLSDGRLVLGLGIGWQKEEYAAVGVPYADRGARLEECIGAMRALWRDGPASFEGRWTRFSAVHSDPRPAAGRIPVVLGGHSEPAVRRAGRIGDGWFPFTLGPDEFAAGADLVRSAAAEAGRAADAVELTTWPGTADPARELDADWVRRYVDAGCARLVMRSKLRGPDDLGSLRDSIARYQDEVLVKV